MDKETRHRLVAGTGVWLGVLSAVFSAGLSAEAVFDGSVGPQGVLNGDMLVDDSFGSQVGSNLFHSFTTLNVNPGESLTFTSGFAGVTDNVISRVTGSTSSLIDGPVFSDIPGASLWLINPNGMVFGPGAFVDVQGGFHASTADYLLLEDGGRFGADLSLPGNTTLTMGNPASFGFLTNTPSSIEVDGAGLFVPYGETLELVAGEISVSNGLLVADGGTLGMAGVAEAGELGLTDDGYESSTVGVAGNVSLASSFVSASGDGGGAIFIRAGQFVMETQSVINAETQGFGPGRGVDLQADDIRLTGGSRVSTSTYWEGSGGDVHVQATRSITVAEGSSIDLRTEAAGSSGDLMLNAGESILIDGFDEFGQTSFVGGPTFGAGDGAAVVMDAPVITVSNGAYIWGSARSTGNGGSITLNGTDSVNLVGTSAEGFSGGIFANATDLGNASDVVINAGDFNMLDAAYVFIQTRGPSAAGNLLVNARGDVTVAGTGVLNDPSFIFTGTSGTGPSGNITINAANMRVADGAQIGTFAPGPSDAGRIDLNITHSFTVEGSTVDDFGNFSPSRIDATGRDGDGGHVEITAREIVIGPRGEIKTQSFGQGTSGPIDLHATESFFMGGGDVAFIFAESGSPPTELRQGGYISISAPDIDIRGNAVISTYGAAGTVAGDIDIHADNALNIVAGEDAFVFISSEGAFNPGTSGDMNISGRDVRISGAELLADVSFTPAKGGTISIEADNSITLDDYAYVASVNYFADLGGDIFLSAPSVTIKDGASVVTDTYGVGEVAGNVYVTADDLLLQDGGVIDSNSCFCAFGDAGSIFIDVGTLRIDGFDGDVNPDDDIRTDTGIRSNAFGSGRGGNISISADTVLIDDMGSISSSSRSTKEDFISVGEPDRNPGDAGSIRITARELRMEGSAIQTEATEAAGGSIEIQLSDMLYLENSTLVAQAFGIEPNADGGNVTVSNPDFIILKDSGIIASANAGNGGNIQLTAGALIPSAYSVIDASSRRGLDGRVVVEAPNDLVATTTVLEAPVFDISEFAQDPCEIRVDRERSSFTIEGQGGVPPSPDDYVPSPIGGTAGDQITGTAPKDAQLLLACK